MMKMLMLASFLVVAGCDAGMDVGEAKDQVRKALRDPSSAEFSEVIRHPPHDNRGAIVCGYVNAKNGFGGMTGPKRFLVGATAMIDDDQSETGREVFQGVWASLCE